ncbi:spinster family MFS transporter [Phenylobacterium immobile]|uniref:spinster family MFS transporter n=1 Tax=Phenylobacterium immobile TaxID=21 RepID=UPI000AC89AA9|nr:MFS transporter [Phenylobacterium immobile]
MSSMDRAADSAPTPGNQTAAEAPPSRPYAIYVLVLLALANIFNTMDRIAFTLLMEPIKRDLNASDTQMSLLSGFAFVLFYTVFGIPIARWADRWVRRTILAMGLVGWSVMTMLCGVAGNFWQMALVRAGVGIGESAGIPPSLSLITDYFQKRQRAQAIAIFQSTAVLAMVVGAPLLGLAAAAYGWRGAFIAVGAPGVLLGLVIFLTVKEPVRGRMDRLETPAADATTRASGTPAAESFMGSVRIMFATRGFQVLFAAQVVLGLAAGITQTWTPAFMMRVHGVNLSWATNILAPTWGVSGVLGGLAGGFLAAHMVRRTGKTEWMVIVPGVTMLLAIPAQLAFIFGGPVWLSLLGGCTATFFMAFKNAPMVAEALDRVPASSRSLAGAMMLIGANVLGQGFGPLFTGMLSDLLLPTLGKVEAIRWAFMLSPILGVAGGLMLLLNLRAFRRNVEGQG